MHGFAKMIAYRNLCDSVGDKGSIKTNLHVALDLEREVKDS